MPIDWRTDPVLYVAIVSNGTTYGLLRAERPGYLLSRLDVASGEWVDAPSSFIRYFIEDGGITDGVPVDAETAEELRLALLAPAPEPPPLGEEAP